MNFETILSSLLESPGALGAAFLDREAMDAFHEIAMRIEKSQPVAVYQILPDQDLEEARFPGAGLSDRVEVGAAILRPHAEGAVVVPPADAAEVREAIVHRLNRGRARPGKHGCKPC